MASYFIYFNNCEVGPMSLEQLRNYRITPNTMIRVDNGPWVQAYTCPEVMGIISSQPPQYAYNNSYMSNEGQRHIIAGILAVLIGTLGIQYFYIGKNTAGIITILLSLVTCGIWGIVTLVQGILMLMMTEQEFDRKYVNNPSTFPLF